MHIIRAPAVEDMHPSANGVLRHFAVNLAMAAGLGLAGVPAQAADLLDLQQFRGKVVLVDFWASWCEPCRHSFPWLNELQAKYADRGLVIVGVNVDRTHTDAQRFLTEVPASFEIVYDPQGSLATRYEVPGMPSSYLFGPTGELISRHIGFREAARSEREAEIEKSLASPNVNPTLGSH